MFDRKASFFFSVVMGGMYKLCNFVGKMTYSRNQNNKAHFPITCL